MTPETRTRGAATWALLSLAIGSFGIGMTEFVVMGLLPQIAQDLLPELWGSRSEDAIAATGWLITLYAAGVVVGAPIISGLVARYPRHLVLIGIATALTVFNGLTVLMPTFGLVAASRFLAGLPHGVYFGIGALVAAEVMGPGNRAKGVAFVLTGLTVANIVGVPLGTFLGQEYGWRTAFMIVTAIFALATLAIVFLVPRGAGDPSRTFRKELRVFRIPQIWLVLAMGAIGFGGFFAVYSYVAPLVTEVAGSPDWAVPIVLVLMGIGMTVGNLLGGYLADRDVRRTLYASFGGLFVVLVLLALTASWILALGFFVLAVGVVSSIASPAIQTRLMDVAEDNQSIAAALNHSALNIGNSLGALLGGLAIAAGLGFVSTAWIGAALSLAGLAIAIWSFTVQDRGARAGADLAPFAAPADSTVSR